MNMIDTAIPKFLDRRPLIWTYTMLQTYLDTCAHQAYRQYVAKKGHPDHIPYVGSPAQDWGNKVHEALEYRVLGQKPLPADMHQFEKWAIPFDGKKVVCEPKLAIDRHWKMTDYYDNSKAWGRNRCDVAIIQDDKAYLIDWKTGNSKYENAFELEVQAMFLRIKYPQLRIVKGQFCWLKDDKLGPLHDLSDFRKTAEKVQDTVRQIEADRERGEFDKEPGPLCSWCNCLDCEYNKKRT